jgi:hypothetical protein
VLLAELSVAGPRPWRHLIRRCDLTHGVPKDPPAFAILTLLQREGLVDAVGIEKNLYVQQYELTTRGKLHWQALSS